MTEASRSDLRGNNLDLVRRRNLALVLRRVHELGAVSRARLTKETGLNRSTIAALVAELVQLGLVLETDPDQTNRVGRPSIVIVPSERAVAITVHPELDAATICLVALGGRILRHERYPTRGLPSAREVVDIAATAIGRMRSDLGGDHAIVGVGLAIPGLVRASDGVVTLAPHLEWRDEPIGEMLRAATGYEVFAANDASLGAIAERIRGAGRGVDDLVYLNGGASGIGGGIIAGGVLLGGASGYAGEIGHTLVNSAGLACHCGSTGCLETEVQRAPLLEALGLDPSEADALETTLLARLASAPSAELTALVERQVGYLARALANTVNTFNPELILLGGFLGSLYAAAPHALDTGMRSMALVGPRDIVRLERATLGATIIELGAAELAFRLLIADPAGTEGSRVLRAGA
ncbi:MAG: transcriptional regulator [Rhodoglobus sp.]|nr:transcriptional regulator [Rhodoglobus sp.]